MTKTKQEYPKAIFDLLGIIWNPDKHLSSGGTVTASAWHEVHSKLDSWQQDGILDIVKGLEKFKKSKQ